MRALSLVDGAQAVIARSSASTTVATANGLTAISGLSLSIGLGTWRLAGKVIMLGDPGGLVLLNCQARLVASGGLVCSTALQVHSRQSGTNRLLERVTTLGTDTPGTLAQAVSIAYVHDVEAVLVVTTAGTVSVSMTGTGSSRTGAADAGSYLEIERMAP